MGEFDWDGGLDFQTTLDQLTKCLQDSRTKSGYFGEKKVGSYAALLTQLKNGSRISEARDALEMWSQDGVREHQVRSRKEGKILRCDTCKMEFAKRAKTNTIQKHFQKSGHPPAFTELFSSETRLMLVPDEILENDLVPIREALKGGVTVKSLVNFSRRNLGFNTHSLRYANTTHMGLPVERGGLGLNAQIIAKIQHRKNVNLVIDYFEQKVANDILREMVK